MGVISDAIDALEDWCCDLFKDGIKSQFDGISDLLTDTFSQTTGDGGLVSTYLTSHPASFTGGGTGGTSVWTTGDPQIKRNKGNWDITVTQNNIFSKYCDIINGKNE